MEIMKVDNVTKRYMTKTVLNGVSMTLEQGKVYGLFGPNASGKTTLMKIFSGLTQASSGSVEVQGSPLGIATKRKVSYIPTANPLPMWMKVKNCVDYYADLFEDFNRQRAEELLEMMGITREQKVNTLSTGMLGRLKLVLGISRDVPLYILDEPLNGLDSISRDKVISLILDACQEDRTFLISSHLINELENILDEVIFIERGKVVLTGNAETLRIEQNVSVNDLYKEVFQNA